MPKLSTVEDTTALVDRASALLAAIYESKTSSTMDLSSGTRAQFCFLRCVEVGVNICAGV